MAPDSAPIKTARVALVGTSSLLGKEVKDQLAASGFPGEGVSLFDLEEVAGVLTEYGKEARVLAETVADNLLENEVICFCGDRDAALEHRAAIGSAGKLAIDCTGAWPVDEQAFEWIPGVSAAPEPSDDRQIVIPAASGLAVGALMDALGDLGHHPAVTVFLPASDRGEAGLRELSQQSIAVLNLEEVDTDVFGRQLAFDLWPNRDPEHGEEALAATLERLAIRVPALHVIAAPVFHGMGLSTYVPGATAADVAEALAAGAFVYADDPAQALDSPVRATGKPGMHVLGVREDGGGAWVWLTVDNLHARAAATVAAIHALAGIGVSGAPQ